MGLRLIARTNSVFMEAIAGITAGEQRGLHPVCGGKTSLRHHGWIVMEEKIASIKALLFHVLNYFFKNFRAHFWGAAEYPEVLPVRGANNGVFILLAEVDDPVISAERPEKRDLELGIAVFVDHPGAATGLTQTAILLVPASVYYIYLTVRAKGIHGGTVLAAFLETVRVTTDFVPQADIAMQIDMGNGLQGWQLVVVLERNARAEQGE
jgi:hypothetical protein